MKIVNIWGAISLSALSTVNSLDLLLDFSKNVDVNKYFYVETTSNPHNDELQEYVNNQETHFIKDGALHL